MLTFKFVCLRERENEEERDSERESGRERKRKKERERERVEPRENVRSPLFQVEIFVSAQNKYSFRMVE